MVIWALEGVWVTSERRHCEARKGVGALGRARRPGGLRLGVLKMCMLLDSLTLPQH